MCRIGNRLSHAWSCMDCYNSTESRKKSQYMENSNVCIKREMMWSALLEHTKQVLIYIFPYLRSAWEYRFYRNIMSMSSVTWKEKRNIASPNCIISYFRTYKQRHYEIAKSTTSVCLYSPFREENVQEMFCINNSSSLFCKYVFICKPIFFATAWRNENFVLTKYHRKDGIFMAISICKYIQEYGP